MDAHLEGFEVLGDERVGEGGALRLRRMRLKLVFSDGSRTREGLWDYVERPMGLDAVVVALWHRRAGGGIEVLLRSGARVALHFGRPHPPREMLFPELIAGIIEPGEESEEALQKRAADEAMEEAGLRVAPGAMERLGPPLFPTPGMCPELFHFLAAEVHDTAAAPPEGDGSPFEQGARIEWVELGEALARCGRGQIQDMKTELGLRRLREKLFP
jgi:ADP-ribose pyrophosphatase